MSSLVLPEIEFQQQLFGLGLLHSVYTYDVTEATEQAFLAGLRMPADKRVQLGIVGGFGGMDPEAALLAAGLLLFSIGLLKERYWSCWWQDICPSPT